MNPELSKIAAHNLKELGRNNIIFKEGDSIEFLKNTAKTFDCIFIDPARRDNTGGKVLN